MEFRVNEGVHRMNRLTFKTKENCLMQPRVFRFAVCGLLLFAGQAAAATVEEVVAQYLEARGGEAAIMAVQSARTSGTMRMGGSAAGAMEVPFTVEFKRPDRVRVEFSLQGMIAVQAYDGQVGWSVMPFLGKTEPEEMAADQLKDVKDQADFDGPLVNYNEKGHTIELVGEEEMDGAPAFKLKVTKANGDVVNVYLDLESFIELKSDTKRMVQGTEIEVTTRYRDYKKTDGLLFAHLIEMSFPGNPKGQVITINTIELGVDLADDRFTMPAKKPGEEAPTE
jgi:outer membrane lipoprotein-sorting protein